MSDGRLKLVEVPDLLTNTEDLLTAVQSVVESIVQEVPAVLELPGLVERRTKLQDADFVTGLIHDSAVIRTPVERLRLEFADEQAEIDVLDFDPVSSRFHLRCRICGHEWRPRASNAYSSKQTGRKGTRCPTCADRIQGRNRRKPILSVIAEGRPHRLSPAFSPEDYKGVTHPLAWTCDVCGRVIWRSVNMLRRGRGCKHKPEEDATSRGA